MSLDLSNPKKKRKLRNFVLAGALLLTVGGAAPRAMGSGPGNGGENPDHPENPDPVVVPDNPAPAPAPVVVIPGQLVVIFAQAPDPVLPNFQAVLQAMEGDDGYTQASQAYLQARQQCDVEGLDWGSISPLDIEQGLANATAQAYVNARTAFRATMFTLLANQAMTWVDQGHGVQVVTQHLLQMAALIPATAP
jgi:hypothetical protein